uniref:Uncharacterized protein n=1 Tax=Mola mola TaxID=94237 RepID=A0A3Q3W927_MOLML
MQDSSHFLFLCLSLSLQSLHRCCQRSALLFVARRPWSSSSASLPPLHKRLLLFLTQRFYDVEMLVTCLCCVLRYVGQSDWFRADQRGKFNWDFLNHKDVPLEDINLSYTLINYTGLTNLGNQKNQSACSW